MADWTQNESFSRPIYSLRNQGLSKWFLLVCGAAHSVNCLQIEKKKGQFRLEKEINMESELGEKTCELL